MILTYLGKQYFRIQQGDLSVAFNPRGKASTLPGKPASFGADIAFVSANHPDYNGIETVSYGDKKPFPITGPGDYEVKDFFIKGIATKGIIGGKEHINTVYTLAIDGISLCFLGALSDTALPPAVREGIGTPDIVFVPIGGKGLLNALEGYKLALSLDPKIIIPMDYGPEMEKDSLKTFLKEAGAEKASPEEKLVLKKKDLEGRSGDAIVLAG